MLTISAFLDVLYRPDLSNYWTDLIVLVHTERTYVEAVQRGVIFDFSAKMPKLRDSEQTIFASSRVYKGQFVRACSH